MPGIPSNGLHPLSTRQVAIDHNHFNCPTCGGILIHNGEVGEWWFRCLDCPQTFTYDEIKEWYE